MRIQERGLIFDARLQAESEKIAFFPGLCSMQSGTLLCGFQVGPVKNAATSTVRLCRSRDGGRRWQELPARFETSWRGVAGSLGTAEMVEIQPGHLLLFATWFDRSDPARPLFDPVTEGILHTKQLHAVSTDEGDTWSAWEELPLRSLKGCTGTGPLVSWPDGSFAYAFESFREFDDPNGSHHAAWMTISRDQGRTFSEPIRVAEDPQHQIYYWDQRLCAGRRPGEWIGLFWTHDLNGKTDLNVHLRRGSVHEANSPIVKTSLPGQIAAPLLLPDGQDGRLLAFVVDRHQPGTLKLWQSMDEGRSWPEEKSLVVHAHEERAAVTQGQKDIDFKQYWEDMGKWSFGHPVIHQLEGRQVLLVFYAGTPDRMSIHWARVDVGT